MKIALGARELGEIREIFLAEVSRPRAQVVAADGVRIKSVKLHFLGSSSASLKSEIPSTPRITRSPSMAKCVARIFSAASAIFGERCVQSAPLRNSRTRSFCQMGVSRCFATRYADRSSNDGHDASENEPVRCRTSSKYANMGEAC